MLDPAALHRGRAALLPAWERHTDGNPAMRLVLDCADADASDDGRHLARRIAAIRGLWAHQEQPGAGMAAVGLRCALPCPRCPSRMPP